MASWLLGIQNEICLGSLHLSYMAGTSPLLNLHFDVVFKEKNIFPWIERS